VRSVMISLGILPSHLTAGYRACASDLRMNRGGPESSSRTSCG
jgi:hypothetical protein